MVRSLILTSALCGACFVTPAQALPSDYSLIKALVLNPQENVLLQVATKGEEQAQQFIDQMGQAAIGFLSNPSLSKEQKSKEFEKLLNRHFDMKTIGKFALGKNWRVASKDQQNEYQRLFERMVVDVYSGRFNDYAGQDFVVLSSRAASDKDYIVSSEIVPPSGAKINVDWRVRQTNGTHKVIDVIIEGVSMSLTQRSEFASVIQRGGGTIESLLTHLRQ